MDNVIAAKRLKEILSKFPSTIKTIRIDSGYIFFYDKVEDLLYFSIFPLEEISFSVDFKLFQKMLDTFSVDAKITFTEQTGKIVISDNDSTEITLDATSQDSEYLNIISLIRAEGPDKAVKNPEELSEAVVKASSVCKTDHLSGILSCICITESGEVIATDNVRILKIDTEESLPQKITLSGKTAALIFKNRKIFKIKLRDDWAAFYDKENKIYFCCLMPTFTKYPNSKITAFIKEAENKSPARYLEINEEVRDAIKKLGTISEGKSHFSKIATVSIQKNKVVLFTTTTGGTYKKEVKCKNEVEMTMTLQPTLFQGKDSFLKFKIIENALFYKSDKISYVIATGE